MITNGRAVTRRYRTGDTERKFMLRTQRLGNEFGWMSYHTHDSRGSEPGFPDVVFVHADAGVTMFIEFKTDKGRLTIDQCRWMAAFLRAGRMGCCQRADVWRPRDQDHIDNVLANPGDTGTWHTQRTRMDELGEYIADKLAKYDGQTGT